MVSAELRERKKCVVIMRGEKKDDSSRHSLVGDATQTEPKFTLFQSHILVIIMKQE